MRCNLNDIDKVSRVMSHPESWAMASDDFCDEDHKDNLAGLLLRDRSIIMAMPNDNCLFLGIPVVNGGMLDIHAIVHPDGRGKESIRATKQAIEWVFSNYHFIKLISFIPINKPEAAFFAQLAGFKQEGLCEKSLLKSGEFVDQLIFGLSKEILQ